MVVTMRSPPLLVSMLEITSPPSKTTAAPSTRERTFSLETGEAVR